MDEGVALGQITPRRFELLLACLELAEPFTSTELRALIGDDSPSAGSLLRDLRALELGGWLLGDPPHTASRQGRAVHYRVNRDLAGTVFHRLAARVDAALT